MRTAKRPKGPEAAAIRYVTDLHGWTMEELADQLQRHTGDPDWTEGKLNRISAGTKRRFSHYELRALSEVLGVSVDFITGSRDATPFRDGMAAIMALTVQRPVRKSWFALVFPRMYEHTSPYRGIPAFATAI